MKRKISMAASVMSSMSRIWRDKILQLSTKIRLYQALLMSVLLYAAETCDEKTLEAFRVKCQRQILHMVSACHKRRNIRWYRFTTCCGLHQKTPLDSRLFGGFGHIARLTQRPTLPRRPSIRSFTWWGLETSSRSLDRTTPQRHWICSCQPLEAGHSTAMVERRDDDDDDDSNV